MERLHARLEAGAEALEAAMNDPFINTTSCWKLPVSVEYLLETLEKCDRAISLELVRGSCTWGRIQRDRVLYLLGI